MADAGAMTAPRSQLVDSEVPGFYHSVSRCVRRAFLCGTDSYTGRSFEHRRAWVEERLLELADIFAVGVYAFAVMSNHVHVVAYLTPATAWSWSPEDVAQSCMRLFPVRNHRVIDAEACHLRAEAMRGNADHIVLCLDRLASLSWFGRWLSDPIAVAAVRSREPWKVSRRQR
jgi:hypothetical protein